MFPPFLAQTFETNVFQRNKCVSKVCAIFCEGFAPHILTNFQGSARGGRYMPAVEEFCGAVYWSFALYCFNIQTGLFEFYDVSIYHL